MEKIFVVIPNWNGADMIRECLESLAKQTTVHTVVVVDNGSVDESVGIIESSYPAAVLIKLPHNIGFAGGVNRGIEYALEHDADAVALFNNDAVAKEDWLKHLAETMLTHPEAGMVTGKLMRTDKIHIDSTGDFYTVWGMPFPRGRNQKDEGQYDTEESVFGASGGATLYRAKMLREIGLFDEYFFAYLEDVDVSFRAQLAGWKTRYTPHAVAYHHVGGTSSSLGSFTRYHYIKNFYMTYAKNMPSRLYWKYLPLFIIQSVRLFASAALRGSGWAYIRGTARAFLNTPHIIRERRKIQENRKVSVAEIDKLLYKHRPPRIPELTK